MNTDRIWITLKGQTAVEAYKQNIEKNSITTMTNCFAYMPWDCRCAALKERYCDRTLCPFYKNKADYEAECARLEGKGAYDDKGMAEPRV